MAIKKKTDKTPIPVKKPVKPTTKAPVKKTPAPEKTNKKAPEKDSIEPKKPQKNKAKADIIPNKDNPKHAKIFAFISEFQIDKNATQAAIRAGYAKNSAREQAHQLLTNIHIKKLVEEKLEIIAKKNDLDAEYILLKHKKIVEAKTSTLSKVSVRCCRYCWHHENKYLFTPAEFERKKNEHDEKENEKEISLGKGYVAKPFDEKGGIGFDGRKPPNPDCPECFGDGITRVVLGDTDSLGEDEQFAFDGAEITKDGMKVKHASKTDSLKEISRHIGFYNADKSGAEVAPIDYEAQALAITQAWINAEEKRKELEKDRKKND